MRFLHRYLVPSAYFGILDYEDPALRSLEIALHHKHYGLRNRIF